MEKATDRDTPTTQTSHKTPSSVSTSTTSSSNGSQLNNPAPPAAPQPQTPKSLARSEPANPYPTTFVQADPSSFKQVVQMLTGSAEPSSSAQPPARSTTTPAAKTGPKRPAFKLYERRPSNSFKSLKINPLVPGLYNPSPSSNPNSPLTTASPRFNADIPSSPSVLDFPSLSLSPVTPLIPDSSFSAEDRAIAEKKFYLHPSPRSSGAAEPPPRLLPLFPVSNHGADHSG